MKRCRSASNVNDGNNEPFIPKLSKKARKRKKSPTSATHLIPVNNDQSSSAVNIDDIIDSVVNASNYKTLDINGSPQCDNCSCACNELKSQLDKQQLIINKLACHLNFVLSFLNIAENVDTGVGIVINEVKTPNVTAASISDSSISMVPQNVVSSGVNSRVPNTWSEIVVNGSSNQSTKPAKFNDAVMSAVYADKYEKERRSKSFIVSGMRARSDISDKEAVSQLCKDEFGINPTVVFCKRLGEERTTTTQPILVAVNSVNQAEEIITCAKSLRRSTDLNVKNNIYINPNLTKGEAHAAYLERCKRRLQATQRPLENHATDENSSIENTSQMATIPSTTSHYTRVFNNSLRHKSTERHPTNENQGRSTVLPGIIDATTSSLTAAAPSFVPSTGQQVIGQHAADPTTAGLPSQQSDSSHSSASDRH